MGILGKSITKAIQKGTTRAAYYWALKNNSDEQLVKRSKANNVLIVDRKIIAYKRGFVVKDGDYNKIYVIKRQAMSGWNATMKIVDVNNYEFAKVIRKPSFFNGRDEFELYIEEEYFGSIYQKDRIKPKLYLPALGWTVSGNFTRGGFKVHDRNQNVVVRIRTANLSYDTYVIEYDDATDELFVLFVLMAVELAYHR